MPTRNLRRKGGRSLSAVSHKRSVTRKQSVSQKRSMSHKRSVSHKRSMPKSLGHPDDRVKAVPGFEMANWRDYAGHKALAELKKVQSVAQHEAYLDALRQFEKNRDRAKDAQLLRQLDYLSALTYASAVDAF